MATEKAWGLTVEPWFWNIAKVAVKSQTKWFKDIKEKGGVAKKTERP